MPMWSLYGKPFEAKSSIPIPEIEICGVLASHNAVRLVDDTKTVHILDKATSIDLKFVIQGAKWGCLHVLEKPQIPLTQEVFNQNVIRCKQTAYVTRRLWRHLL